MLGRVVKLQAVSNAQGLFWGEGIVEARRPVSVQVVEHDANAFGLGIVHIHQLPHLGGKVQPRALGSNADLPPASQRLYGDKQIRRALPLVLVVMSRWLSLGYRHRWPGLRQQLQRFLVEADQRTHWIVGLSIQFKHVFHGADEVRSYLGEAPLLALPGLEVPLFSVHPGFESLPLRQIEAIGPMTPGVPVSGAASSALPLLAASRCARSAWPGPRPS